MHLFFTKCKRCSRELMSSLETRHKPLAEICDKCLTHEEKKALDWAAHLEFERQYGKKTREAHD